MVLITAVDAAAAAVHGVVVLVVFLRLL